MEYKNKPHLTLTLRTHPQLAEAAWHWAHGHNTHAAAGTGAVALGPWPRPQAG